MKPTSQTQSEADRADLVYQYALSRLGARTVTSILALWQGVPAGQAGPTKASWVGQVLKVVLGQRGKARDLGLAYYRMTRALRTGTTIAHPLRKGEPEAISLELLRQEFEALVAEHTGEGSTEVNASQEPDGEDDSIDVEVIDGLSDALKQDTDHTVDYAKTLIEEMADAASAKVDAIPEGTPLGDARKATKDMHTQHGAMVAAAGQRVAMNGARHATNQASGRDPRIIGWVRQSSTGTPCYWCAMLISRRVLYKTKQSAGSGNEMLKFHDNCHCVAEPVYSDSGMSSDPKYAENRKYAALWDQHIKGKFSGADAMSEWRDLLRRIRAEDNKAAQEAA